MTRSDPSAVHPGDHVQVWNRYLGEFAGDFEVVEEQPEGFTVRPRSERSCLPGVVRADRVRPREPGLRSRGWSRS